MTIRRFEGRVFHETGEHRPPLPGEWFLCLGHPIRTDTGAEKPHPILRCEEVSE